VLVKIKREILLNKNVLCKQRRRRHLQARNDRLLNMQLKKTSHKKNLYVRKQGMQDQVGFHKQDYFGIIEINYNKDIYYF
jgi:hypothetical protein